MKASVTISFPRVIRNNHSAYSEGMRATHVSLRDTRHVAPDAHTASRRYAVFRGRAFIPFLVTALVLTQGKMTILPASGKWS